MDQHHGSESYYVLGEGLLTESGGGRAQTLAPEVEAQTAPFRFSRMGPSGAGEQLGEVTAQKLAAAMTTGTSAGSRIPSGFTYLGQFIDHDLTFDKTNVMLGVDVSPADLLQGRSPILDLDSLYGAGAHDPGSAQFYSDGLHLKMGTTIASGDPAFPDFDLPRVGKGSAAARRTALIPEPRNDENLAVAQTHLAFIRFHNRVCDTLPASTPAVAAVHPRAAQGQQALPVDDPHRLPAPHRRQGDRGRRLHERPQGLRGRRVADRHADDADRVLDRRLPARPQHGAGRLQLEQELRRRRRHARPAVPVHRQERRTSAARTTC